MVIVTDNGLSLVAAAHRSSAFMGYKRGSRIAGNVTTTPSSLPRLFIPSPAVSCLFRQPMKRAMSYNTTSQKNHLWNTRLGIRFFPRREPKPLYPKLDVARFLHNIGVNDHDGPAQSDVILDHAGLDEARRVSGNLLSDLQESRIAAIASAQQLAAVPKPPGPEDTADETETGLDAAEGETGQGPAAREEENVEPPWTPLDFNISSELFHAARASTDSADSFWSHTMYQKVGDNGSIQKVKVHYCISKHSMEHVCQRYFLGESVLGFDLEWLAYANRNTGPRENVSLIQIASPSRIALFHVALFPKGGDDDDDLVTPTFRKLMGDPGVSKVGVNIRADFTRLKTYLGVDARGVFELSHLYRVVKYLPEKRIDLISKVPVALSTQVLDHLRLPLYKDQSVRSSNWMKPLDPRQLLYSASDAYAGIQLYYVLEAKRKALNPCPPRPHHAELGLPIPLPEPPADVVDGDDAADSPTKPRKSRTSTPSKRATSKSSPKPKAPEPPLRPEAKPRDARITAAELKMNQYRSCKKTRISATPAALRAYYMWHDNQDLKPVDIARLLRDPPLKTSTVVSYILDAVMAEKLPYSRARLKSELLCLVDPALFRYNSLVMACCDV